MPIDVNSLFLNFTQETLNQMNPIDEQCTVLCEITEVKPMAGKKNPNSTNVLYIFTCIDDNSPFKDRNGYKTVPMGYASMHADIVAAANLIEKRDIQVGQISVGGLIGKKLYVKFDFAADQNGGASIQPVKFFRPDKTPVV